MFLCLNEIPATLTTTEAWKDGIELKYESEDKDVKLLDKYKHYHHQYNEMLETKFKDKMFVYIVGCNFTEAIYKIKFILNFKGKKE